nr:MULTISPECIES: hypothetical protein [unclassified Xenorhabdus]
MSIVEQLIKKQKGSSSRQHSSKKNNTNNSILEEESDHKKYNLTKGNVLNRYSYRYENIPTKRNKIPERKRVPAASALQGRNPQWHEVTHAGKNIYGSDQEINVNHIIDPLRSIARRPSHFYLTLEISPLYPVLMAQIRDKIGIVLANGLVGGLANGSNTFLNLIFSQKIKKIIRR